MVSQPQDHDIDDTISRAADADEEYEIPTPRLLKAAAPSDIGKSLRKPILFPVWNTSERLWRSVIAASPELSYGYNNLGAVLMARASCLAKSLSSSLE